jgi:hypothetical protein
VSLFTRSTAAPDLPQPVRSLALVKEEIAEVDAGLTQVGFQLRQLYRQFPEDLPMAGAFRMSSSRPLHTEVLTAHKTRYELQARWSKLLQEFCELKGRDA